MEPLLVSYAELKIIQLSLGVPFTFGVLPEGGYRVRVTRGGDYFEAVLKSGAHNVDIQDFNANHKAGANTWTSAPRVHASARPADLNTFFSSAGDDEGIAKGELLLFDMLDTDDEKFLEITYDETVWIKDGYVICKGAPLGAWVSAETYDTDGAAKVTGFVTKALILGDAQIPFDTEDYGTLLATYRLRLTVHNSDGTGDQDAAAAFKVVARVKMYRATTI